jgi:replicative DNA helicase
VSARGYALTSLPSRAAVPPQNLEAETSVLGAMLQASGAIKAVLGEVEPADFYYESHGAIFTAAVEMHERGEPVDAVTLAAELERRGMPSVGVARLCEYVACTPATANTKHWARIVGDAAVRRDQLAALESAPAAILNGGVGAHERDLLRAALADRRSAAEPPLQIAGTYGVSICWKCDARRRGTYEEPV